jgi:hypothetical protein
VINACTVWFVAVPSLFGTSLFFNWPLPLKDKYFSGISSSVTQKQEINGDSHSSASDESSSKSHRGPEAEGAPAATNRKNGSGRIRQVKKEGGTPNQTSSAAQPAKVNGKDIDCDIPDGGYIADARPRQTEAFVKSFTRQVLDGDSKIPLLKLDVSCGDSGQEKKVTDIDGFFECSVPAHTSAVLVEIADSRYEHYYRRLNPSCNQPILLQHVK